MIRHALLSTFLALTLLPVAALTTPENLTPADAAPYLGAWALALERANGPGTFDLSLRVEEGKVTGDIGSAQMATTTFTSVAKAAKGILRSFSFPYEGMTVDAVVSLVPEAEGKMTASIDFAGGAYTMGGSATKKADT